MPCVFYAQKCKLTILGVIFKLNLKFTPIIRTSRLTDNKLISHGYGVNRMDIAQNQAIKPILNL
ncbi:hypothetical protein HMPREF1576_00270, partial [Gardnerella pickettii JCP7719]